MFDPKDRSEKLISEGIVDIVKTYQSSLSSKIPFASNVARNRSVLKPSRSQILGAGKQRLKQTMKINSIKVRRNAKLRKTSNVGKNDVANKTTKVMKKIMKFPWNIGCVLQKVLLNSVK